MVCFIMLLSKRQSLRCTRKNSLYYCVMFASDTCASRGVSLAYGLVLHHVSKNSGISCRQRVDIY